MLANEDDAGAGRSRRKQNQLVDTSRKSTYMISMLRYEQQAVYLKLMESNIIWMLLVAEDCTTLDSKLLAGRDIIKSRTTVNNRKD